MISGRLKKVILKELNLSDYDLRPEMRADEVPGWDSLNHINVILAVEREYALRFKATEVVRLKDIGELQRLVDAKVRS